MSKTYFITGASSGFGRALAEAVLERGDRAVLTARRADVLANVADKYAENALAVAMDVTVAEQRSAAIQRALERFGRVDVLVNNAGRGSLGAMEEFSPAQIRAQMELNFFAAVDLTLALLPSMRAQKSGHIVNVSSIGGLVSMGGFALYCASKFALEGFSEGLRDELKPLGIHVTIVEPGAFRTEFSGDANMRPENSIADYEPVVEPIRQYLYGNNGKQPGDPRKAALAMIAAIESDEPPLRLILGADAYGLWEKKRAALDDEFEKWRSIGVQTAFDGVEVAPLGDRPS
jgi:NAD(P)-dependent dehydrogenase (short-subunit alcohol dehydrogenase family)